MTKRQESGFNWRGVEFGPEECEGRARAAGGSPLARHSVFLSPSTEQQVVR